MGMFAAIARVRAGAKQAGLEGALASLGEELKGDAIPERLREAAARLASLLGSSQGELGKSSPAAEAQAESVQGEAESVQGEAESVQGEAESVKGEAESVQGEVVPDEFVYVTQRAAARTRVPRQPELAPVVPASTRDASVAAVDEPVEAGKLATSGHAEPPAAIRAAAVLHVGKPARAKSKSDRGRPPVVREKNKEKVAGEGGMENNPARSVAPAAKKRRRNRGKKS